MGAMWVLLAVGWILSGAARADCPDGERAFLTSLVGSWSGTATTRDADARYVDGSVVVRFEPALSGCAVVGHEELVLPERQSSSVVVITALDDGSFELARADSEHGGFTVSRGTTVDGSLDVTWSRELTDRVLRTRTGIRFLDDGSLELERHLSRSLGAAWEITYRARLARAAAGDPGRDRGHGIAR